MIKNPFQPLEMHNREPAVLLLIERHLMKMWYHKRVESALKMSRFLSTTANLAHGLVSFYEKIYPIK